MKLIIFEGIEKVGKTTNIKYIANFLLKNNYKIKLTREPGGTIVSEKIRNILLNNKNKNILNMNKITELFLILAARYEHLDKIIIPSIMRKKIVLCDRFMDSTYAYQCGGRMIKMSKVKILEKLFFFQISPDLIILLNYPVKKSMLYLKKNIINKDRIEKEKISFFIRVKKTYIKRAILKKNKYLIINCNDTLSNIQNVIKKILIKMHLIQNVIK